MSITDEQQAVVSDAKQRIVELMRQRERLLGDADDSFVLSHLTTIESQIRSCLQALADDDKEAA
jgi:hypothetical protein